jgi:hypothetical protein
MNTTERDHILFGTTPPVYSGGVAIFTGLTLEKIQLLVEKEFLDPTDSINCAPEFQDYIDFIESHPDFTAHGYTYGPERIGKEWPSKDVDPAHTIVLEGIEAVRRRGGRGMKTKTVGVYTRNHPSHAWSFEQQCSPEMAEIARQVNQGFGGVETLVVPPVGGQFQRWLCASTCSDSVKAATDSPFHPDTIRDFVLRFREADEFKWETDHLYCWYD